MYIPRLLVIALMLISSMPATAAQEFTVDDGQTIKVTISEKEPTRIAMTKGSKLQGYWGPSENLEVLKDPNGTGDLFVRPKPGAPDLISFFVRDSEGSTYTIMAMKSNIPTQTVILKPRMLPASSGAAAPSPTDALTKKLKNIIKTMSLGVENGAYSYERRNDEVKLWAEVKLKLTGVYSSSDLIGEV
ncbi:MAG: type-F conjugative transfer system secretin TraK, partial [Pseudobdellovibrionaceae bacterium]|nr:type-F conjugative transfer system secretin TraK [Pseudobdellovibrionaceae bacterium]